MIDPIPHAPPALEETMADHTAADRPDVILRLPEVLQRTGLSRPTIYRLMAIDKFPAKQSLGPRAVGWKRSIIEKWMENGAIA